MQGHAKTRIFSLIGRRIRLHVPYYTYVAFGKKMIGFQDDIIMEQLGPARFGLHLDGYVHNGEPIAVDFHRAEFKLPPLPRSERRSEWLPDDYDGFAYADEPNF